MKWLCKKDFKMIAPPDKIAFTAGETYEEIDRISHNTKHDAWTDVFLIDDDGERHGMDLETDMARYFKKVSTRDPEEQRMDAEDILHEMRKGKER